MAQTQTTRHEELLRDYVDLWNGDYSKFDIVDEEFSFYDPAHPDGEVHGRDEFEEFVRHTHRAFPDWTLEKHTDGMLTSENVVMLEWTVSGTHEGEFYGAPPSGRQFEVTGMAKTIIEDGQLQDDYIYFNQKEMLDQLGFTFPDIIFLAPKLLVGKIRQSL